MSTDWVVNDETYGSSNLMSPGDTLWLPLTFEQIATASEFAGGTDAQAHFEDSPKYALRVRGQLLVRLTEVWSDTSNQFGDFYARIVRNRMDPVTQEPGLPTSTFYTLDNAVDANDDFLWQTVEQFTNVTGWFATGGASGPGMTIQVDSKVNRRLDVPEQLWLVMEWISNPFSGTAPPRLQVDPYLRTLLSDGRRA